MKKTCIALLLVSTLFIIGCNKKAELTSLQRRQLEARDLQGNYENAYKATLEVLQDYGYVIENTDHASGVIHGKTGVKSGSGGKMSWLEATATIEQFGDDIVKERLSLLKKEKTSSGSGRLREKSESVEDPEFFAKIFDDIQKEIFIRENINK
jgi:hypothetical protein